MGGTSSRENASEHKDVKVAKITALQAVVVALITAVAGIGAGYFASATSHNEKRTKIDWIYIDEIRPTGYVADLLDADIRLTFTVNGVAYSFPAKALWATFGDHTGAFPLPPADEYVISFAAYVQSKNAADVVSTATDNVLEANSQRIARISASSLPFDKGVYSLTVREREFVYGSDEREGGLEIVYSIR